MVQKLPASPVPSPPTRFWQEGTLKVQRAKMSMALRGKSPHYNWDRIKRRHWLQTAKACGFLEK